MQKQQLTLGAFEYVGLPAFGEKQVLAKLDTGAFSGAVHCTDIKVVRRGPKKERVLTFNPFGNQENRLETKRFQQRKVRSATGHEQKRFIIDTEIDLAGEHYSITIGLSDRSDMTYEILLGRRFLRDNNVLIDPRRNQELDDEWENGP